MTKKTYQIYEVVFMTADGEQFEALHEYNDHKQEIDALREVDDMLNSERHKSKIFTVLPIYKNQ